MKKIFVLILGGIFFLSGCTTDTSFVCTKEGIDDEKGITQTAKLMGENDLVKTEELVVSYDFEVIEAEEYDKEVLIEILKEREQIYQDEEHIEAVYTQEDTLHSFKFLFNYEKMGQEELKQILGTEGEEVYVSVEKTKEAYENEGFKCE